MTHSVNIRVTTCQQYRSVKTDLFEVALGPEAVKVAGITIFYLTSDFAIFVYFCICVFLPFLCIFFYLFYVLYLLS